MHGMIIYLLEKLPNEENAVNVFFGFLGQIGLWPALRTRPRRGWALVLHAWNYFLVSFGTISMVIILPGTVYLNWGVDLMATVEAAASIFVVASPVAHAGTFMFRGELFHRMAVALEKMTTLGGQHRERPKEVAEDGRWRTWIGGCHYAVLVPLLIFVIGPCLLVYCLIKREYVIRIWFPFDYRISPYFEVIIFSFLTLLTYGLYVLLLVNSLLMAIMAQTSFQLALLSHNIVGLVPEIPSEIKCQVQDAKTLERCEEKGQEVPVEIGKRGPGGQVMVLGECKALTRLSAGQQEANVTLVGGFGKAITTKKTELVREEAERRLRHCVEHYQAITSSVYEIRTAFGPTILLHFITLLIPVALAIVIILFGKAVDVKMIFIVFLTVGMMAQMGLICYLAERIVIECESVRDAVYGCDWFDQSESFKRSMRVIMSRSNQPLVINPLGVSLTMETFYKVVKLAFTYYMSLSATLKPPQ